MHPRNLLANLNLANQLTFLRLVAVPFFIISILQGRFAVALGLFLGAALTDLLDGLTARLFQQGTPLGAYLDPAADKILLTAAFLLLTEYPSMFQDVAMVARVPVWLTILVIFRDVSIVAVALILYLTQRQTRFTPSIWGKLTTVCEMVTIGLILLTNALGRAPIALAPWIWITCALTFVSGFHYMAHTIGGLQGSTTPSR